MPGAKLGNEEFQEALIVQGSSRQIHRDREGLDPGLNAVHHPIEGLAHHPAIDRRHDVVAFRRGYELRRGHDGPALVAQSEQFIRFGDSKTFDLGAPVDRDFGEHGKLVTRSNIYFEAVSAFKHRFFDRTIGKLVAERLKSGDVLLVTRLDRAWRLTSDCLNTVEALKRRGVQTYIISFLDGEPLRMDTAQGLICLTTCACFASDSTACTHSTPA